MPISPEGCRRRSLRGLAVAAATAALLAAAVTSVSAATLDLPVGKIDGIAVSQAESLVITATTDGGGRGTALYTGRGGDVSVTLDCVRTYAAAGVTLFPTVGAYGYASGVGTDGHRYYILVNQGYGISVSRQPGAAVSVDTCGVGYVIPTLGATAIAVVPQRTRVWTLAGVV